MISVVLTHGRTNTDSPSLEEEWRAHLLHVRGAMNLLRQRGMSQFTTPRGEKIFRIFKAAIVSYLVAAISSSRLTFASKCDCLY